MKHKPRIAIYDFTDCEGCQVEIVSLCEELLTLEQRVDIVDWRLGQERKESGPFLAAIIEGTPITQDEIDTLKWLRENSKYLISLGACASLAGIPGIINKKDREKLYKQIYPSTSSGQAYKPKGIDALPLSFHVKIDFMIHGCPVNPDELVKTLEELLSGRTPSYRPYSVCFECKLAGNPCRITNGKPCLGPITQGGCNAVCVSGGSPCYGCFGAREEADVEGLKETLKKFATEDEIKRYFTMFYNKNEELQK